MFVRALVVSSLAVSLTGCGALFAEAEAEEICKTISNVEFPGVPGNQAVSLDTGTDYDLSSELAALPMQEVDGDLTLRSLTFTPTRGVPDLSFVDAARISVLDEAGTPAPVVDYERKGASVATASLELASAAPPDLFSYLTSGKVKLAAQLSGVFPQSEWAVDARACFHVRTRVNYASALQAFQAQ